MQSSKRAREKTAVNSATINLLDCKPKKTKTKKNITYYYLLKKSSLWDESLLHLCYSLSKVDVLMLLAMKICCLKYCCVMQMLYESKLILVKFEECLEANCEVVERATEKKSKYSKKMAS